MVPELTNYGYQKPNKVPTLFSDPHQHSLHHEARCVRVTQNPPADHQQSQHPTPIMATTTPDPSGSAFPWIIDHLLQYPGTYEIPLRTMYTNNILAQAKHPNLHRRPPTPGLSAPSSTEGSPITPQTPQFADDIARQSEKQAATDQFKSCLMEHVSYLPSQPFSLPPSFITSFVRRCFTEDLCQVDFTQALTALDYLKDLETRRKRELSQALQRLGIQGSRMDEEREELEKYHPRIGEWIASMEDKERKVEALYTQVYIGLRRWVSNSIRIFCFLHVFHQSTPLLLLPRVLSSERPSSLPCFHLLRSVHPAPALLFSFVTFTPSLRYLGYIPQHPYPTPLRVRTSPNLSSLCHLHIT